MRKPKKEYLVNFAASGGGGGDNSEEAKPNSIIAKVVIKALLPKAIESGKTPEEFAKNVEIVDEVVARAITESLLSSGD